MSTILERLTGLTLLHPWFLLLLAAVPLAALIRRRAPSMTFGPAPLLGGTKRERDSFGSSWRVRLLALPAALQVTALVLVAIALARPVHRTPVPLRTEGIDILLALDVSSSMTAKDMDRSRSRLAVAREAAAEFIHGRPADRIGLVAFARYPDLVCPPTLDHDALTKMLLSLTTVESDGAEDATGIGTAVARSAQALRGAAGKSRVVILLTDGEENVATTRARGEIAPVHAGQLCEELGVRVYAVAAGGDGTAGRARVDTRPIEDLAARTGGRFFAARDADAVGGVYGAIDELERAPRDEPRYEIVERFAPFVLAAIGLVVAARLAQSTFLDVLP